MTRITTPYIYNAICAFTTQRDGLHYISLNILFSLMEIFAQSPIPCATTNSNFAKFRFVFRVIEIVWPVVFPLQMAVLLQQPSLRMEYKDRFVFIPSDHRPVQNNNILQSNDIVLHRLTTVLLYSCRVNSLA